LTRLAPFVIDRAESVAEATELLEQHGDDAVIYAGGTELLLVLKLGFASYERLVDVKPIEELRRLEVIEGRLVIGATVTHRTLERADVVRSRWPDLALMERLVANVRVRSTGTLGGNLAFADPHSDPATFLLAANAVVELGRGDARRRLGIDAFVLGPYETALESGEVLCAILVPEPPAGSAIAHLRFKSHERPAATVSAWMSVSDGRIVDARLAVGSVGASPVLVRGVADGLAGQAPSSLDPTTLDGLGEMAAEAAEAEADANGAVDYKQALVRTLVGRALRQAAATASTRSEASA
jgi:carbon-monoxide dehydrogenase medium subunit